MNVSFLYLIGAVLCQGIKTVFLRLGILKGTVDETRFVRAFFQTAFVVLAVACFKSSHLSIPLKVEIIYPVLNGLLGGLAFIAFCRGLQKIEASRAKPILAVRMAVSVILGVLVLGEAMTTQKGAGIIMAGVAVLLLSSES